MQSERKYAFSWSLLGDLEDGRPNLGATASVEAYRLMQFCFRDELERRFGTQATDEVFLEAGRLAGRHFAEHVIGHQTDFDAFIAALQRSLREMGIGVLRVEKADLEQGSFVLTVSEDLDCSGLPDIDTEICVYDEGFIAALMESFAGRRFEVKEIDCWCTGDRTCRFTAEATTA
jgi:predicted hydrocarbon binding protein